MRACRLFQSARCNEHRFDSTPSRGGGNDDGGFLGWGATGWQEGGMRLGNQREKEQEKGRQKKGGGRDTQPHAFSAPNLSERHTAPRKRLRAHLEPIWSPFGRLHAGAARGSRHVVRRHKPSDVHPRALQRAITTFPLFPSGPHNTPSHTPGTAHTAPRTAPHNAWLTKEPRARTCRAVCAPTMRCRKIGPSCGHSKCRSGVTLPGPKCGQRTDRGAGGLEVPEVDKADAAASPLRLRQDLGAQAERARHERLGVERAG
eukprot:364277-Chlamydomonas_euryale.AAC.21